MSRRKVRGLTRTGRQVSEDPDLDNLLSTLSPEEVEELEKDMMKVPDLDPNDGKVLVQGEHQSGTRQPMANSVPHAKVDGEAEKGPKSRLGQREQSFEGEQKKESRKQEYLRKRGLSQEGEDDKRGGLQRQASISTERDNRLDTRDEGNGRGCSKEEGLGLSGRNRTQESRKSNVLEEAVDKDECEDGNKTKYRRDRRESAGSKTKDMISKLQEKKDDTREKEKKEDSRRRDDGKTKDIISKLREKSEKEAIKEKDGKDEVRKRGRVSMMLEKQSKAEESHSQDGKLEKKTAQDKDQGTVNLQRQKTETDESVAQLNADKSQKRKENDEEVKPNNQGKAERKLNAQKSVEEKNSKENGDKVKDNKGSRPNNPEENKNHENCVAGKSPHSKAEDEEDEDSSMFDELMEQVRTDDPTLLELNVNNSEVIKIKTLIQFAEALHKNTCIKTFALANCRADDHVAYAIAGTLRNNKTITSINLDSNLLTGKGIMSLIQALQHNSTLTELRFHNQRHICGGKTEMEMTKILKENTTLLKLGYHFELAGPRMTMTNILSRNMDRQRQKRLQEQKQAQANGEKKGTLEVPKTGGGPLRGSPRASPKPSPMPSPMPSPKLTPKRGAVSPAPPPPPPPPGGGPPPPPPPVLDVDSLRNSLTPVSQRKLDGRGPGSSKNSRDQLLASIRENNKKQLKKVSVPKLLQ